VWEGAVFWHALLTCNMSASCAIPDPVKEDKSRLRRAVVDVREEQERHVEAVLAEKGPLIRGTVGRRRRKCGHSGCHCNQGERHESKYLSVAIGGRTRMVHLPEADVTRVDEAARRYRRFRRARAQLVRLGVKLVELVDRLGHSLLEGYPPGNPAVPAARRGRKAQHGARRG
jgi:hypothetical protein